MSAIPSETISQWLQAHPEVEVEEGEFSPSWTLEWVDSTIGFSWTLREALTSDLSIFLDGGVWVGYFPSNEWIFGEVLALLDSLMEQDEAGAMEIATRLSLSKSSG